MPPLNKIQLSPLSQLQLSPLNLQSIFSQSLGLSFIAKQLINLLNRQVLGSIVVGVLDCQLSCWGSNACHGRYLVSDLCSTCTPGRLSYDDYTDRILLV